MSVKIIQADNWSLHREGCRDIEKSGGFAYDHGIVQNKEELLAELIRWQLQDMGEPDNEETYCHMLEMLTDGLKPCTKLK